MSLENLEPLLSKFSKIENRTGLNINPFPSKGEKNRLALDRVKSISALSAHSAVKGLNLNLTFYLNDKATKTSPYQDMLCFNLAPRVFYLSPPQRESAKKDPGSGWLRVSVTNLSSWEGSHVIKVLSPLLFVTS